MGLLIKSHQHYRSIHWHRF